MSKDKKKSNRFQFRAWHPELGMSNVVMVNNHGFLGYYMNKDMSKETALGEEDGVILMQCTGRIDNQGEDIYSGDILSIYGTDSPMCYVEYQAPSFVMVWIDPHFKRMRHNPEPLLWNIHFTKILGNIHENPELLSD